MRLVSVEGDGAPQAALLAGGQVVPLVEIDPSMPRDLTEIVKAWPSFRERLLAEGDPAPDAGTPVEEVKLAIPFEPTRVMGTGGNYSAHAAEMRSTSAAPKDPSAFLKLPGTTQGPDVPLQLRDEDHFVDYEGEIAMVVGAPARDLDTDEALDAIAGLMLANDVSARDWPLPQITLAKGAPGFCPLGPWLVTLDELDLEAIEFSVEVNGEPRQSTTTATMIHNFVEILVSYSQAVPLEPGDVILTGTPGGVGIAQDPPVFLVPGDEIVVSSPQLGVLRTSVVAATGSLAG